MERVPETDAYRGVADDALVRLVDELSTEHGLEFITTRRLLCLLAGTRPTDVASLVRGTGASRRRVEEVLARLTDHLDDTADGYRVRPSAVPTLRRLARCDALLPAGFTDPPPDRRWTQLRERMRVAAAGLPPSVWRLDHVPATADTAVRRAYALWANYELAGNHVLCLGDHDLTSIALTLVSPEVAVTVVDIDERILDHIATLADDWRLPVRCAFADLRAELPPSLREGVDLVFTDPPNTPAGIELFLARGVGALRRRRGGRVLFCYSHNERQPARGLEVQNVVSGLHLAVEGVLPRFNAFDGAESIGSHSALWICQPTANAWPAAERHTGAVAIYTRGRQAEETAARPVASVPARLRGYVPLDEGAAVQLVGTGDGAPLSLDTLLRTEPPAGQGGLVRPGAVLLADLTEVHPSYAYRLLLRGLPVRRAVFAVSAQARKLGLHAADHPVWRLVAAKYRLGFDGADVIDATASPIEEVPEELRTARYVLDHPKARLAGAWREALVAQARRQGRVLVKNQARQLIAASVDPRSIEDRYLCELPERVLGAVARAMLAAVAVPEPVSEPVSDIVPAQPIVKHS